VRILVANDGFGDAGGVQTYLEAVAPGLAARGHTVAMLHLDTIPLNGSRTDAMKSLEQFSIGLNGSDRTIKSLQQWGPEICFSHNMRDLELERQLFSLGPVVKFMHGYFGTCIGGQKTLSIPGMKPCSRTFGAPCVAMYLPRRCGQFGLSILASQYGWALEQRALFGGYRAIVVASQHMRSEFVRNGADTRKVHVNPLFSGPLTADGAESAAQPLSVVFIGRMTKLKGGDLLVRAVAEASTRLGTAIELTMVGDGPQRAEWEKLAARLNVRAGFVGWKSGEDRWPWLRRASLLAVPSVWPEPFGLVGLEAAAFGVPAIAFDVGGIREWLTPRENGFLVPRDSLHPTAFADELVTAFSRPELLAAMRCKARAVAGQLSLERHLDRLEEILDGKGAQSANPAGR
jgi:glycosyltransferase involved in cell wall biosynthesis